MLYDYFITIDQEIKHFWRGPWTLSRCLYFFNRYVPPCIILYAMTFFFQHSVPSGSNCQKIFISVEILESICLVTIQAVVLLRGWYLYIHTLPARIFAVLAYAICSAVSWAMAATFFDKHLTPHLLPLVPGSDCKFPLHSLWRMYAPVLTMHVILYGFTAYRAFRGSHDLKHMPILKRLLRDNGIIFLVFLAAAVPGMVAACMPTSLELFSVPMLYSSLLLALSSISVSHLMLSLHTLAANLSVDPTWLNHAELSRVNWRRGEVDGELLVDIDDREYESA